MSNPQIEYKIGLIGGGKMGTNLFNYLIDFPFNIVFLCKNSESADKIEKAFKRRTKRALKHNLLTKSEYEYRISKTTFTQSLKELCDCDLIIESITEDIKLKKLLFKGLDEILQPNCIITSNSSSISPNEFLPSDKRNGKILGLHFFYPVSITNIVEINTLKTTDTATINFVKHFLDNINKKYLILTEENHFLINRLLLKLQAGCCNLHSNFKMSYFEIDSLIKKHLFPIGVFEFFDQVGIDVMLYSVKNYTKDENKKEFFKPLTDELKGLAKQGKLGIKTKEGFYSYNSSIPNTNQTTNTKSVTDDKIMQMIYSWYLEPLFEVVKKGICTKIEIEYISKELLNAYKNPFELADNIGYTHDN